MPRLAAPIIDTVPPREIVVGVGDLRVGRAPSRFLATYGLGSCVAVVLFDWRIRAGALLHVMMPDSSIAPHKARKHPLAFVDIAVPRMIESVGDIGMSVRRSTCCLVGGASMIAGPEHFEIGRRNVIALRSALSKYGIFIDREEVGGHEFRSIRLDVKTGAVTLQKGKARECFLIPPSAALSSTDS